MGRWRDVVGQATDWGQGSRLGGKGPFAKEGDEEVALEVFVHDEGDEVEEVDECEFEDDRDVGGVEQLDWVGLSDSSDFSGADQKLDSESLDVQNNEKDYEGGDQAHEVWCV